MKRKKPQTIFVNSMSDLFHKDVPTDYIRQVFEVMNKAHWHNFQVLTKRAERVAELSDALDWSNNIWMGVSVESRKYVHRIDALRETRASTKFLSCEPLLSPLKNLDLANIDWVIVGGESGHKARPMKAEWAIEIQRQCAEQGVSFFFKQWGAWGADGQKRNKKANGRILLGKEWNEKPINAAAFA